MIRQRSDLDRPMLGDKIRWRDRMPPRGLAWVHDRLLMMIIVISAEHLRRVGAQPGAELQNNSYGYLANFNSSMAIVVIFLVCAFFLMGFFSVYLRRCADTHIVAGGSGAPAISRAFNRRRGLDPAVIETFPILVYSSVKSLKIGKGSLECAVCLSEFEDCDTLRLLPKCSHVFHPDCIDAWLASHVTCPVCRSKLSPESTETTPPCTQLMNEDSNVPEGSSAPDQASESVDDRDHVVVINVDEIQENFPEARARIAGRLPRSHSTGHSLIRLGECTERYTLRLPEEVRKQLAATGKLKRCASYNVVLPRVGSSKNGKAGSDLQTGRAEPSPWVFSVTPPFFTSGNCSIKSPKGGEGGDVTRETEGVFGRTSPFDCRSLKGEKAEESPSPLLV